MDSIYGGGSIDDFKAAQQTRISQAATEAKQGGGGAAPDAASQGAAQGIGQAQGGQSAEYPKL